MPFPTSALCGFLRKSQNPAQISPLPESLFHILSTCPNYPPPGPTSSEFLAPFSVFFFFAYSHNPLTQHLYGADAISLFLSLYPPTSLGTYLSRKVISFICDSMGPTSCQAHSRCPINIHWMMEQLLSSNMYWSALCSVFDLRPVNSFLCDSVFLFVNSYWFMSRDFRLW